jgi:cytochrome c oxidase cbb3-type subunit I
MQEARSSTLQPIEPDFAARQTILWAVVWLVAGVSVALALPVLLVWPELVGDVSLLSYERLRPAADSLLVFGWLGAAGFAAIYALLPRITNIQLHNEVLGAAATLTWSVLLVLGVVAVWIFGMGEGRPLAELPAPFAIGLFLLLVVVLYNAAVTAVRRREQTLYPAGWFLLAAALLAPVVFAVGNFPAFEGVVEVIVGGFYLNGLEMLWLLPLALGVAHYVVPVETGKALFSAPLARTTFWSLVFAGGWTGQRFLLEGPGPDYLDTIAVAMTVVLVIPVLSAAVNLYGTGRDRWELVSRSFGLRFAATGLGFAMAWIALVVLTTTPPVYRLVGLTAWQSGVRHLAVFGVFSFFGFALIYHVYPLMVGRDWFSRPLATFHFWATGVAVVAGTALLLATGVVQAAVVPGAADEVIALLRVLTAGAFALLVVAQYAFAYNTYRTARSGPIVELTSQASAAGVGAR